MVTPKWYAVTVRPQHERSVERGLNAKGFETYLPLFVAIRKWSDRLKRVQAPLFPGYVFCRLDPNDTVPILQTVGIRTIVSFGGLPAPVPEDQIETVRRTLASGLEVEPWPFLKTGQKIRIASGPLSGVEGTLLEEAEVTRLVINIEMFKRACAVRVERANIIALAG